ncbi:MAG: alpha/beta hydrolase [Pelagimonas sp.]|jgi:hypothetical protein|nr:alpha/beta hydrolase [Pelagimonas sp.]
MLNMTKIKSNLRGKSLILATALTVAGCAQGQDYQPFTLTARADYFVAQGVIDGSTPGVVRKALNAHPEIKKIIMQYVPGSADDEANLEASRLLRESGISMVVPEGGLVASGGTDMFLAGVQRDVGSGACIGVHSWGAGSFINPIAGRDVPKDDPQHQLYLSYYDEIGIDPAFYWYTLDAADADNIHYMTLAEMQQYGIATSSIAGNAEAQEPACEAVEQRYGFS